MKQKDFVIKAMVENGNLATFSQLYRLTDVSSWQTKTPFATIRRIVQTNKEFFKIQPGLWGLSEFKSEILSKLNIKEITRENEFTHSYFQGIIAQIGNLRNFYTYIPPQDKNRFFIDKKLHEIATTSEIYEFSYPKIIKFAKTIDAIWFNERKLPHSFFEVEHSTDFRNSLNKFYELQDFNAKMFIVADKNRRAQFNSVISASIYESIASSVRFVDYDSIVKLYEKENLKVQVGI
ncbi:hypothetical protein [Campylobacter sp. RM16190]|uniref:hypothetical protein n=1 Tax=Campylobacter sp. RM16190 TaxID=1705727 RepID=UPI001473C19C|nr:hypothetical protein [Campylobacter sp. RM16190]